MFKFGLSIGACADNPVSRVQRLKEGGKSHRFLTKKEIDEAVERGGLNEVDLKELRRYLRMEVEEGASVVGLEERAAQVA
jgi:hypothetical protein